MIEILNIDFFLSLWFLKALLDQLYRLSIIVVEIHGAETLEEVEFLDLVGDEVVGPDELGLGLPSQRLFNELGEPVVDENPLLSRGAPADILALHISMDHFQGMHLLHPLYQIVLKLFFR